MGTVTIDSTTTDPLPAGVLRKLTLVTVPPTYENDYFCLVQDMDGVEHVVYNFHIATSPVHPGSVLVSGANFHYANLRVKSCPVGASFELETEDEAPANE